MVILAAASGIAEDASVNTLHFSCVTPATDAAAIAASLETIWDSNRGLFPATVAQNGHRIKIYNLADAEPRAPLVDTTFNLDSAPSGAPLPTEVALCLSFQAGRISGQSQARRRGRIYWGPIKASYNDSNGRPDATAVATVLNVGDELLAASTAATDWSWGVFSRVDDDLVSVQNGWVDNAWDIQRRRGLAPTTRSTFS